jgi:hypothetical protein
MVQLTDEQKNDDLVKSLLGSGFSEEVIAGWIDSGSIKLEKSVQSGPDDHGEGDGDGEHEKKEKERTKKKTRKTLMTRMVTRKTQTMLKRVAVLTRVKTKTTSPSQFLRTS